MSIVGTTYVICVFCFFLILCQYFTSLKPYKINILFKKTPQKFLEFSKYFEYLKWSYKVWKNEWKILQKKHTLEFVTNLKFWPWCFSPQIFTALNLWLVYQTWTIYIWIQIFLSQNAKTQLLEHTWMKKPNLMWNAIRLNESLSAKKHHNNKIDWNRLKNFLLHVCHYHCTLKVSCKPEKER